MSERKKDQVKALLRDRLMRGELHFGDKIFAKALTEETGASRFMVITALNELQGEGFLDITAQVGVEVIQPSLTDITDFFVVFGHVEGAIAEFAAERRDADHIVQLRSVNAELKRVQASDPDSGEAYRTLNLQFHRMIHVAARSPRLAERQFSQWAMADFFVTQARDYRRHIPESVAEHEMVIAAVERHDGSTARALMRAHIHRLGQDVVAALITQTEDEKTNTGQALTAA